jgi:hypothetical protein
LIFAGTKKAFNRKGREEGGEGRKENLSLPFGVSHSWVLSF